MTWRDKAKKIIAALSLQAYNQANRMPNGKLRKRHRPYVIPDTAQRLVKALDENDEETAKAIFMYDYDAEKASR